MELQNSLRISHLMLIVFRIVSPEESEGSSAQIAMQILHFILSRHFPRIITLGLILSLKAVVCPINPFTTLVWH